MTTTTQPDSPTDDSGVATSCPTSASMKTDAMSAESASASSLRRARPLPLSPARRAELERFRWYNTSLDEVMEELGRVEAKIAAALKQSEDFRHFEGGYERELIQMVRDTLQETT